MEIPLAVLKHIRKTNVLFIVYQLHAWKYRLRCGNGKVPFVLKI